MHTKIDTNTQSELSDTLVCINKLLKCINLDLHNWRNDRETAML